MKAKRFGINRLFFMSLILWTGIIATPGPAAAEISRVAVVPFTINAEKDLTFLRDGIADMLTSRLSWEGRVVVVGKEDTLAALTSFPGPLNESRAREIGARLGADYTLFGSLTVFGDSVSMDAKMVDVRQAQPTLSFYNQSQGMGEVIPRINVFAEEINEKVFDKKTAVRQLPAQTPRETPGIYAHPERLLEDGTFQQGEGGFSPFVMTRGSGEGTGFWKSRNFKENLRGLAVGDVDGDGKNETVLISSQSILIYRFENGQFLKIKEIPGEKGLANIGVDVADIKQDGRAEIFVTCHRWNETDIDPRLARDNVSLASFVLEWDGQDFVPIAQGENWYFRVYDHPQRGTLLLGQNAGSHELFRPGIHELAWVGGSYVSQSRVTLPKDARVFSDASIFGMAMGDLTNSGNETLLTFDPEDRLRLYTFSGEQEWKSIDRYGGSENFLLATREVEGNEGAKSPRIRKYLSPRILAADLDKDGKTEVVVVKNNALTGRFFRDYRRYDGIQFESLSWNGLGMAENWHTRQVSGYCSDYALGDVDNDGEPELVAVVVSRRGSVVTDAKSAVIAYNLGILAQKTAPVPEP
ncbi:MAG: FG-GAP-like repeat-containing protein [Pseudomonadota bacterium]